MLEELKEQVCCENRRLVEFGLVLFTWGNVSAIDSARERMVIKPSGVPYEDLQPHQMVVVDVETGKVLEGELRPSSDTPTHQELYKGLPKIGGVVHTHSRWATVFAQAQMAVPVLGTTHGDYFYGSIPCTRHMTKEEITGEYESKTGQVILEAFRGKEPMQLPAVLVSNHGPFTWGRDAADALHNAVVLEELAFMAWHCLVIRPEVPLMQRELLECHYFRKHGPRAYYGQI